MRPPRGHPPIFHGCPGDDDDEDREDTDNWLPPIFAILSSGLEIGNSFSNQIFLRIGVIFVLIKIIVV